MTASSMQPGDFIFASAGNPCRFSQPESVIACSRVEEVVPCLTQADAALARGRYVAGYLAYEAGWAFMDRPSRHALPEMPLLWLGVYADQSPMDLDQQVAADPDAPAPVWTPELTRDAYADRFRRIRDYIAAGDTYQVNFTFPFTARCTGDPWTWFQQLYAAQPTEYAAFLHLDRHAVLSLSPELFFRLDGDLMTTRPMKGTRPRGRYPEQDREWRDALRASEKDRAENVMIVDLLRNDMGRISRIGSVETASLFDVERYATVWQMTSTIQSRSQARFSETMQALFPCGSVTGAPKIRTMEIIEELEDQPRGVYCGAIGWWGPERRARFNVAIRTIALDLDAGVARYAVGGGITWGSNEDEEYAECLTKIQGVARSAPDCRLIETLLYDSAWFLLEGHLNRLCASADLLGFSVRREDVLHALTEHAVSLPTGRCKVRLLLARNGAIEIAHDPAPDVAAPLRVALAAAPVNRNDAHLYHKTTRRAVYEAARASRPDADDVLLWNADGELTESTIANLVVNLEGKLYTPPVACGLLPGVLRDALLQAGILHERILTPRELAEARALYLINSVRGWMPAQWMD